MEFFKECQRIEKEYKKEREELIATIPFGEEIETDSEVQALDFHYKQSISIQFQKEYERLIQDNIFFDFCQFSTYQENYNKRLNDFIEIFPDASEIDFIRKELRSFSIPFFFKIPSRWQVTPILESKIDFSDARKKDYLIEKAKMLNYNIEVSIGEDNYEEEFNFIKMSNNNFLNESKIKWKGSQTELIELIKALIESGTVIGKQKDIIKNFTNFFDIEIKHPDKLISDLNLRNNGSETLFLDKLKSTLYNYLQTKNKR